MTNQPDSDALADAIMLTPTPDELRAIAEAAMVGPWRKQGTKIIDGGNWHVAEAGSPSTALHIATFDPPTILAMLDERSADKARIAELERDRRALMDEINRATKCMNESTDTMAAARDFLRKIPRAALEHGDPGK